MVVAAAEHLARQLLQAVAEAVEQFRAGRLVSGLQAVEPALNLYGLAGGFHHDGDPIA